MADIHNSDLKREIIDGAKINTAFDKIPQQLAEKVVPVMETNPKFFRTINVVESGSRDTSGQIALYTTPTDKDFYITSVQINNQSDVTADNTDAYISTKLPDGNSATLAQLFKLSTTVFQGVINLSFPIPIKIKRGTAINFGSTFTAGASITGAGITGYIVEE